MPAFCKEDRSCCLANLLTKNAGSVNSSRWDFVQVLIFSTEHVTRTRVFIIWMMFFVDQRSAMRSSLLNLSRLKKAPLTVRPPKNRPLRSTRAEGTTERKGELQNTHSWSIVILVFYAFSLWRETFVWNYGRFASFKLAKALSLFTRTASFVDGLRKREIDMFCVISFRNAHNVASSLVHIN